MEVSRDSLVLILRQTTCEWTKGFISCLINSAAPTNNEIARELLDAIGPGQKIQCIKKIRENFGLGLKEAKHVVDEYFASGQIIGLPDDEPPMVGV